MNKPRRPKDPDSKLRMCLGCGKLFQSMCKANRLCRNCKDMNDKVEVK